MKKIPTLFVRDFTEPSKGRYVTDEVTPGCEWVLAGEGVPTRKFDGTCVMVDGSGEVWARREVKAGKEQPHAFVPQETDETTGKTVGWEPAEQSGYAKYIAEAVANDRNLPPGTYELCGPKVQGNPEHFAGHVLVPHGTERLSFLDSIVPDFKWASEWMPTCPYEGVVWHHPDGRMAKLKRKDFPRA